MDVQEHSAGCINEPCISHATLALIVVGVCLTLTSLLWPIDPYYQLDAGLSAQENEQRQANHALTLNTLDIISAVGMGLLVIGAVITSVLLTRLIVLDHCLRSTTSPEQPCSVQPNQGRPQNPNLASSSVPAGCGKQGDPVASGAPVTCKKTNENESQKKRHKSRRKERLLESDQLEMNSDFSDVKRYGSTRQ